MTYFFETYGCQMNIAESASVERAFIEAGWTKADDVQVADFVIINTCSVRETAESRILGRLGWYASLKAVRKLEERAKNHVFPKAHSYALTNKENPPRLNLAIMGCMAERLIDSLQRLSCFRLCYRNFQKQYFPDIIAAVEKGRKWIETDEKPHYVFAESSYEKALTQPLFPSCTVAIIFVLIALFPMFVAEKFREVRKVFLQK